jgi:hypothetical protein
MPYGFFVEIDPARPGHDLPSGAYPGHGLPGAGLPGHDLPSGGHPWVPGHLPVSPPNVWPPLTPSSPIQPTPPDVPPGTIWPPINRPADPGYGRPDIGPEHPSGQPLPPGSGATPPPRPTPAPIPPRPDNTLPSKTYWIVAGIPGVGWRYVAVDPSLEVGYPLPPTGEPK